MAMQNTNGQEVVLVGNDSLPTTITQTPVLDWLTFYCQHGGVNTVILPFSAKSPESAATSIGSVYHLTRRLKPTDLASVTNSITGTTSATSATAMWTYRFFVDEQFVGDLLLAGGVRMKAAITLLSNNASYTSTLDTVILSLKKLTAADTYTTIASVTFSPALTNATTTTVTTSYMYFANINPEVVVTPSEKLVYEISTTAHTSNASGVCTVGLLFNAGTSYSYMEVAI